MTDPVLLFHAELEAAFGALAWLPIPDGQIQRFHVPGDSAGSRNGWYCLHLDGIACGAFGSWKAGASRTWSSRKPADYLEAQLVSQRIERAKRQREAERRQSQQRAAVRAVALWERSSPATTDHAYLIAKGCQPHQLRQHGDVLLVPLYAERQLVNLQLIHPDGAKRFLSGGRVIGAYSLLGTRPEAGQSIYVCEGWATGATIHEHTGTAVACAMNAGNLLAVGDYLRRTRPDSPLIVAGDDDRQTEGNPGRTFATKAASKLDCGLIFPPWSGAEPLDLTDFNDLRQWREANA